MTGENWHHVCKTLSLTAQSRPVNIFKLRRHTILRRLFLSLLGRGEYCYRLRCRSGKSRFLGLVFSGMLCSWVLMAHPAFSQTEVRSASEPSPEKPRNRRLEPPASSLHDSFTAPIFITGHLGFGGGLQHDQFQFNYGGSIIFRPEAAVNFLGFLGNINSAMVLQGDYQKLTPDSRILSGDLIVRHYFTDRGDAGTEVLPFLGVGLGASDVRIIAAEGNATARYWSWLVETGQEWYFKPNVIFVARIQFRHFSYNHVTATTWSVSGALGIPVPW